MSDTEGEAESLLDDVDAEMVTTDYETETGTDYLEEEESDTKSFYDSEKLISGPRISENGTLGLDIMEFDFSYGYDCKKYFNLTVLDENTIVFSSGNFINFFNVETKEITFRRTALGGGIGHIRKNPNPEYSHFAVAECGTTPLIIIYVWTTLEVVCVLKGGAERNYTNLDFNPDGDLLVSQSGDPDFLITIWDWQHHTILLRTKSYVNDVFRVKFSPYVSGQLTTCGLSHIKFWKMASTFTGLKLKGELGRFGKTEYSDIVGVLPMPDAKVVSGCSWGNILVWDDGLITFEVFRSLRRKCHEGPIVQFYYFDGELWTVSMDGHVKVWWFEKIDQADPPDDDRVILVDPTYDFYTPGLMLMSIEKRRSGNQTCSQWFGQDGNGGIWLIDLNTDEEPKPSEELYVCHGGRVTDLAACPFGPYLASIGEAGRFFLYNYLRKKRVFRYKFPARGVCMIWLPLNIVPTGDIILMGFEDGQVRVCCLTLPESADYAENKISLTVTQIIKPHNKKLTAMSTNDRGTLLVTAAEDSTIFIFKMDVQSYASCLTPIGFFITADVVTCITWNNKNEVLVGCIDGEMMQIELPEEPQPYTGVSYKLELNVMVNRFTTYKSQIKRDMKIREIEERKAKKVARKREEMEQIKKDNPGLEIDEETFLADSESEEELEPLFIPEVPNKILWLKYTENNTIWVSMAGFDAGYIYEYRIEQKDPNPLRFRMVADAGEMEISTYVYTHNKQYLIFAMQDGSIRVNRRNPEDYTDLTDYYSINMHDNQNGFVPKLCFSYNEKYFFSCGYDGNIFSYKFNPENYIFPSERFRQVRTEAAFIPVQDVETLDKLSLEETKIKADHDKIQKLANEHKHRVRETLKTLKDRFKKLLSRNSFLLPSQIIPRDELEPDQRVAEYVEQSFHDKIEIVRRKLAYDVEKSRVLVTKEQNYFTNPCDRHPNVVYGINKPGCAIMTVRQRIMPPIFYQMFDIIDQKMKEEEGKGRPPERAQAVQKALPPKLEKTGSPLEFFLLSLSPSVIQFRLGPKLTRLLSKYRKRREKWEKRAKEWEDFLAKKPVPGKNHPDDEKFLQETKVSFGDYKLKESHNYKVPLNERETTVKHYKKLLETRGKQYSLRHNFIQKVFDIRDFKYELIEKLKGKQRKIDIINEELPEDMRKNGPQLPAYDPNEFPEEKLMVKVVLPEAEGDIEDIDLPAKKVYVEKPTGDKLEKQLLSRKTYPKFRDGFFVSVIPNEEVLKVMDMSAAELVNFSENTDTPFESCLRAKRLNRLLFYQTLIISEMQDMIDDFNNWIYEARKVRLPILIGGNFIDIYIVCLNEELQILKSCEEQEDKLSQQVNGKLSAVHKMEDILDNLKADKAAHEIELENYRIEEGKIQEKFKVAAENNKFYDFLKKVFRKKFKPPKIKADDDSSESSSSSSDESDYGDDTGSIDSKDFGFIKQDLNVCPKGCEPALFNLTVDLRSKRHEIEQNEREEGRLLDLAKKEIDMNSRKLHNLQNEYKECEGKLEEFRREKQKKLNNVRCTVVLHLDQMYGFNPESSDISDFLVFSRSKLSDLYKRVGWLQSESLQQQGKHDTYLKHLMRMKKDIIYMKRKRHCLKTEIVHLLKIKFGKVVDINELEMAIIQRSFQKNYVNELEEVVLKKLVYDLRVNMTDVRGLYTSELDHWQKKIERSQKELAAEVNENTKRLELLAVISKEKKELARFVDAQNKKRERVEHTEAIHKEFVKDLQKLEAIVKEQNKTLQELREEIKMLKTKGMAPKSIKRRSERIAEEERQEKDVEIDVKEEVREWTDYEEYVSEQEYKEGEKDQIKRDITIPGYYSAETEDLVTDLIENLMKDIDTTLTKKSTEAIVCDILSGILKCTSVHEIIKEILNSLPIEISEEQQSHIELSAEKLYSIQELQVSDENLISCVRDILDETISEVLCHDPHYLIPTIIEKLLETLSVDLVTSEPAMSEIVLAIKSSSTDLELDKEELKKSIDRLPSAERMEILDVLNVILENVYGYGIDYLYVI